jgi:hypothetical protein
MCYASVNNNQITVLEKYEEINDTDILFERAKKGITDFETIKTKESILKNSKTGEESKVKTYNTTQLLKVTKDKNGNKENAYKSTTFVFIYLPKITTDKISINGSHSEDPKYDPSYSVLASSTFYFTTTTVNGLEHIRLTSAKGNWTIKDNQVSIPERKVYMACNGYNASRFSISDQKITHEPNSFSFNYSAPSWWKPVCRTFDRSVGVGMWCKIRRIGGDSWTFYYSNNEGQLTCPY